MNAVMTEREVAKSYFSRLCRDISRVYSLLMIEAEKEIRPFPVRAQTKKFHRHAANDSTRTFFDLSPECEIALS